MTAHNPPEVDLEIEDEYVVGLLDYLVNPELGPEKSGAGYRLSASISISLRGSEILAGLLEQYFLKHDINTSTSYREREPHQIEISRKSSILDLIDLLSGRLFQTAERFEFLRTFIEQYSGKNISHDPELFLNIFHTWGELHPEWNEHTSRKYTVEYFEDEFNLSEAPDPEPVPDTEYPSRMSDEYVAGLVDAVGILQLRIQEKSEYSTGYQLSPTFVMSFTNPRQLLVPHLKKYFSELPVSPAIEKDGFDATVRFSRASDIREFLQRMGPYLFQNYELSQFFANELIPAYEAGHHHDKFGFLECVRAYEEVAGKPPTRKYDTKYFEDLWDL
jgi:hypothetical protein